jgi:serine/threonine protein kinase
MQATHNLADGRYAMERPLGRGGVGEVWLAYDTALNRWVAIKRLHGGSAAGDRRVEAALREAKHLAALQHPNIVTVHDCLPERDGALVVMEYVAARTLEEIVATAPLTLDDFLEVARQCLEGLAAAHGLGMLHRDIKASNIMVGREDSGSLRVKILDFGLAKIAEEPSLQTVDHTGSLLGSIHTMAPEQFEQRPLDARTDLYALGCVLYQCLAARPPFEGNTVPAIMRAHLEHIHTPLSASRPDLPAALSSWVERLFARKMEDRPSSAIEAAGLLKAIVASLRRPVTELVVPLQKPRPSPFPLVGAILVSVLLIAGVAAAYLLQRPRAAPNDPGIPTAIKEPPKGEGVLPVPEVLECSDTAGLLQRLGAGVRVKGTVQRIGESRSGEVLYVNFTGNSRADLSLVWFVSAESKEGIRSQLEPFVARTIIAEGVVSEYRGAPQIEISALRQLSLQD